MNYFVLWYCIELLNVSVCPADVFMIHQYLSAALRSSSRPLQVNEGDDDTDLQIFCVSCSHPVNPKVALRHMERCYSKVG